MDQERHGQWLRGVLDLCVLALLARRESYGYELAQALDTAGLGRIQGGTLYPVLLRLQRTGLVDRRLAGGRRGTGPQVLPPHPGGRGDAAPRRRTWDGFADVVGRIFREVVPR